MLRHVGEPRQFDFEPKDHLDLGTALDLIDMERAAKVERLALRLPQGRPGAAAVRAGAVRASRRLAAKGFRPVVPPVLVREEAMYGTGFFPTDRQQVYETDRRRLPGRHLRGAAGRAAHGRVPRAERAAAALRRLLQLLPPRGRRRRQGHARHLPRAPVRQGRDVLLLRARAVARPSTSSSSRSRRRSCSGLGIPYRVVNIAAGDLGAPAAKKYDCEAWLPGPGALPRGHLLLQLHRLPGAAPELPLPHREGAALRAHAQRHRRRRRPHDHRHHGELPARRRQHRGPGGAAAAAGQGLIGA